MTRSRYADTARTRDGLAMRIIQNPELTLFEAGTTTPLAATIYAGPTGGTTLTNPFFGDSDGNFEFYLDVAQDVKIQATGVGTGTITDDWVPVLPPASSLVFDGRTLLTTLAGGLMVSRNSGTDYASIAQNTYSPGVESTAVTIGGTGYANSFAVFYTGGGGSGAAGLATAVAGVVQSVAITNPGFGYTSVPTPVFTAGGGTGAAGVAALVSNKAFKVVARDGSGILKAGEKNGRKFVSMNFVNETEVGGAENVLIVASRADSCVMVDMGLTVTGVLNDSSAIRPAIAQTTAAGSTLLEAVEAHADRWAVAVNGSTWIIGATLSDETGGPSGASGYNESVGIRVASENHGATQAAVRAQSALWVTGIAGFRNLWYYEESGTLISKSGSDGSITAGNLVPKTTATHQVGTTTFHYLVSVVDFYNVGADGSAAGPPVGRVTDSDTGVYWNAGGANRLGFTAGGAGGMILATTGLELIVPAVLPQIATPSAPASGTSVYSKSGGGLYSRAASGSEKQHKAGGQVGRLAGSGGTVSTTSGSYVDLLAVPAGAALSVTLTTTGGDLDVEFLGAFTHTDATRAIVVALSLDGAAEAFALAISVPVANEAFLIPVVGWFTSVAAGSHTVKVRWLTDGATANSNGNDRYLRVVERTV